MLSIRDFGAGAAGALTLTLLHETVRRFVDTAPRMDVVAMRGIERCLRASGTAVPDGVTLHRVALAGDLVSNSIYYAAVPGRSRSSTWARGVGLGLLAGVGALVLPEPLGLGKPPHSHDPLNRILTVSWYLAGGVAAAAIANGSRRQAAA